MNFSNSVNKVNRCGILILLFSILFIPMTSYTADSSSSSSIEPLNRFPRMVQEYFVKQVRQAEQKSLEAKSNLKTKADAEAYLKSVREKIKQSFGEFPEKTPLNPRITKVIERDAYTHRKYHLRKPPRFSGYR